MPKKSRTNNGQEFKPETVTDELAKQFAVNSPLVSHTDANAKNDTEFANDWAIGLPCGAKKAFKNNNAKNI